MLGALKPAGAWEWAAFGKHPVAPDFINVGSDAPIFGAFSSWLSAGHRSIEAGKGERQRPYSWRFWAKGAGKNHLLCGLFRASSDRIGRRYPLMILGSGEVRAWEKAWNLLPLLFDGLWRRMEDISSGSYPNFDAFREDLLQLGRPPGDRWEFQDRLDRVSGLEAWAEAVRELEKRADAAMGLDQAVFPLDVGGGDDPLLRILCWHDLLYRQKRRTPNAVFIGSVGDRPCLAVLNRPIVNEDFALLCAVDSPKTAGATAEGP